MPAAASPSPSEAGWLPRYQAALLLALLLLAGGGCARNMEIGSEPSPTYRIVVANDLAEDMIVSSNHAGSIGILGAVPAGRSDSFVLARPTALDIQITARNAAGTRTVGPLPVRLLTAETVTVRLR
jgi:hypothetical protein